MWRLFVVVYDRCSSSLNKCSKLVQSPSLSRDLVDLLFFLNNTSFSLSSLPLYLLNTAAIPTPIISNITCSCKRAIQHKAGLNDNIKSQLFLYYLVSKTPLTSISTTTTTTTTTINIIEAHKLLHRRRSPLQTCIFTLAKPLSFSQYQF